MAPPSIKMGGEYPKGDVATKRPAQFDPFGLPVRSRCQCHTGLTRVQRGHSASCTRSKKQLSLPSFQSKSTAGPLGTLRRL